MVLEGLCVCTMICMGMYMSMCVYVRALWAGIATNEIGGEGHG